MTVIGTGVDILSMDRASAMEKDGAFIQRAFTSEERSEAESHSAPLYWYASRYAGKEAVFKALGTDPARLQLWDIEILEDGYGAPGVKLLGELSKESEARGIKHVHISLSWETEYALAFAVATG